MLQDDLLRLIDEYNADPKLHGILVQLPLPRSMPDHYGVCVAVTLD